VLGSSFGRGTAQDVSLGVSSFATNIRDSLLGNSGILWQESALKSFNYLCSIWWHWTKINLGTLAAIHFAYNVYEHIWTNRRALISFSSLKPHYYLLILYHFNNSVLRACWRHAPVPGFVQRFLKDKLMFFGNESL